MARVKLNPEVKWRPSSRVKLNKPPMPTFEWQGVFEGWARNWVARNHWRVRELFGDEEDALQECALIFVRCCNSYQGRVDNPAWMMSLFKRAVANDWNTFAGKDSKLRSVPPPDDEELVDHNHGLFAAAVSSASAELRQVLHVIATSPADFVELLFKGVEATESPDPSISSAAKSLVNRRIRRLLGIKTATTDIISELRAILE